MKYSQLLNVVIGVLLMVAGFARAQDGLETSTERAQDGTDRVVAQVLEIDRVLAKQRDMIPQTTGLSMAVRAYVIGLDAIDFSQCPPTFIAAFREHRDAWERSIPFMLKHDSLRGEMHKLFDQIRALGPEMKNQLEVHHRDIMDTWKTVEAAVADSAGSSTPDTARPDRDNSIRSDNAPTAALTVGEVYEYATEARLSDEAQAKLISTRRSVWEAWFGGDVDRLRKQVPVESVTGSSDDPGWSLQEKILEDSRRFAAGGGKLESLVFDRNLIQRYGDTAILYVNFHGVLSSGKESQPLTGRAVEIFVHRNGQWLNTGWFLHTNPE